MPGLRRQRSVLLATLTLAAAAGLWHLAATGMAPAPSQAGDPAACLSEEPDARQPFLVGSGPLRAQQTTAREAPTPAPADTPAVPLPDSGHVLPGATLGPLFPRAPGAVVDHVAKDARAPIVLPRSYVVGRVGPYGVRGDPDSAGVLDWQGVARLERETRAPTEADDDTQEPVTTAVRGRVHAEDGAPIAGAEVILYSSFYLRQAYYDHRVRQIGRVFTGADGTFDLRPLDLDTVHFGADGEVLVTVRHPHHPDIVAQALSGIAPGEESDVGTLVLPEKTARVHGVVRDLAGKPIAAAAVRVSGAMNPVDYDKTERMVVLGACPTAITDAEGRYDLTGFAGGVHELSIHVHIDCVLHVRDTWTGEREWSPRVLAGQGVRGRVVDPEGEPVAAAVVAGGGNWTPTNEDGTFWLDNVQPGPLTLEVAHHLWRTVFVSDVKTSAGTPEAGVELSLKERLPRVRLEVVDAHESAVPLVTIDWTWAEGRGPGRFAPDSRFWHDARGTFALIVPEGATGALVATPDGARKAPLTPEALLDQAQVRIVLADP